MIASPIAEEHHCSAKSGLVLSDGIHFLTNQRRSGFEEEDERFEKFLEEGSQHVLKLNADPSDETSEPEVRKQVGWSAALAVSTGNTPVLASYKKKKCLKWRACKPCKLRPRI